MREFARDRIDGACLYWPTRLSSGDSGYADDGNMTHGPFNWIVPRAQRAVLVSLTVMLFCSSAWLSYMDRNLVSAAAPNGIISFELAGSLEQSEAIIQSWSGLAQSAALLIQGFDYLYLFIYPTWFSLAAILLGARLGGRWQSAGLVTGWIVLFTAPLDAVENYALIQQLLQGANAALAQLALWCALPKFALLTVSTAFLLLAVGAWIVRSLGQETTSP